MLTVTAAAIDPFLHALMNVHTLLQSSLGSIVSLALHLPSAFTCESSFTQYLQFMQISLLLKSVRHIPTRNSIN
jgi:hypothetical protein